MKVDRKALTNKRREKKAIECFKNVEISVWTWCIADYEISCIEALMKSKQIAKATLIIDSYARCKNENLLLKWVKKFGEKSIRFVVNHSKISTIKCNDLEFLIRGSMNLNNNPRFEQFDIDEGSKGFQLVKDIEKDLPLLKFDHKKEDARKASKINNSWTQEDLLPFGKLKVWTK